MKKLIVIFIFLTNMSFASDIVQNINTESQQTLYTQLVDSKIENINNKVENIRTEFDNKTKYLDSYSNNINWWFATITILIAIFGIFTWFSMRDKTKAFEKDLSEAKNRLKDAEEFFAKVEAIRDKTVEEDNKKEDYEEFLAKAEAIRGKAMEEDNKKGCLPNNKDASIVVDDKVADKANITNDKINLLIPEYKIDYHFPNNKYDRTKILFEILRKKILAIDADIQEEFKKFYIAFKINKNNFVDVVSFQKHLVCYLNLSSGDLQDKENKARDVSDQGHWGNGDYEYKISSDSEIDYFISLVEQSYEKNKAR